MLKNKRKYDNKKLTWLRAGKEFAVFIISAFVVFRFIIGVSWISGSSMYPTFHNKQPVIYTRLSKSYSRGDIVTFHTPSSDEYIIKRVVAVGGDVVDLHDGSLWVNGEKEADLASYSLESWETFPEDGSVVYPLTLKPGQFFAVGDNRSVSIDSRSYGPVSFSQIRGKLFVSG